MTPPTMTLTLSAPADETHANKCQLRNRMRNLRASIPRAFAATAAEAAAEHLAALPEIRSAKVVALYAPIRGELCTAPAAKRLGAMGITLAYPRVIPGMAVLRFYKALGPADLIPQCYGIPEPKSDAEPIPLHGIDVWVVPGLAFDRQGHRLGWGKGYYDNTLAQSCALRIGYAHSCQVIDHVPCVEHDLIMDILVTEAGKTRIAPEQALSAR